MNTLYHELYNACEKKDFGFLDKSYKTTTHNIACQYLKTLLSSNKLNKDKLSIDEIFVFVFNDSVAFETKRCFQATFTPEYIFYQ